MIIDFHAHVFPERIAASTVAALAANGNIPAHSDGLISGLISKMEEAGVDVAVNLPVLTRPKQFDRVFEYASMINEQSYTGPRVISFAGMHPMVEDPYEKCKMIKDAGFLGIKLHPDYQETDFDDPRYIEVLRAAKENDLITVTHAGVDVAYKGRPARCTPRGIVNALEAVGGYPKLVLAHMGGSRMFSDVYDLVCGLDVYLDTAYVLEFITKEDFLRMLDKHGEDRILFATDSPWQSLKENVNTLRGFKLPLATERKIFSENARRLLGI